MISNPDVARKIRDLMFDIFTRVDESVQMVKETCSDDEFTAYRKSVAQMMGAIVMDVMAPLFSKHPELKPPNWDD